MKLRISDFARLPRGFLGGQGFRIIRWLRLKSAIRNPHSARHGGQASIEMAVAWMAAVLLLFGSLKVFLWINQRLVSRQLAYEADRGAAGGNQPGIWNNSAKDLRLNIFAESAPPAPPPPSSPDRLGRTWDEQEGVCPGDQGTPWTGNWVRRGTSNVFDATWTHPEWGTATAVITVTVQGPSVGVVRTQSTDGNDCAYTGTLGPDGNVSGTYTCGETQTQRCWSAVIQ